MAKPTSPHPPPSSAPTHHTTTANPEPRLGALAGLLAGYKHPTPPHRGKARHPKTALHGIIPLVHSLGSAHPKRSRASAKQRRTSEEKGSYSRKENRSTRMSTMAMASSSLNPNAPLFIPAAYRQVEDYSPEWWELVKTTAWFRDHWFRQHQLHEAAYDAAHLALPDDADVDVAALLPDDADDLLDMVATDDLFYAAPDHHYSPKPADAYDLDVLRAVSLGSPRAVVGAPSPRGQQQQQLRHADRPVQHVGVRGAARRVIHQPR